MSTSLGTRFSILSSRKWLDYYPLQVVYEWEDILSSVLGISIDCDSQITINTIFNKPVNQFIQKFVRNSFLKNYIDSSNNFLKRKQKGKYIISFFLHPMALANHYIYQKNSIVILLDVWANNIDLVPRYFRNKLIFVTNIEVVNHFKHHSISSRLRYVPLSISDKYFNGTVPEKKIDVLQMGRQNPVLHNWMLQVTKKYPDIEYVYSKMENNEYVYFSTTKGLLTSATDTREEFMAFLGSAKVSLLSSPGIDGGEVSRTGGFNPVTPRFYESAVKYCYMIGRFPDTPDFILNNVSSVCERPVNYDEFEEAILRMTKTKFTKKNIYDVFIKQHLTSEVSNTIKIEIDKL